VTVIFLTKFVRIQTISNIRTNFNSTSNLYLKACYFAVGSLVNPECLLVSFLRSFAQSACEGLHFF
jgi:hypothetical protein